MSYQANLNRLAGYRRDLEIKATLRGRMRFKKFKASAYACSWCLWLTDRLYGDVVACCADHARQVLTQRQKAS